jgi:hypothetical protein
MPDGTDQGTNVGAVERARFDLTVLDSDRSGSPEGDLENDGVSRINPGDNAVRLTNVDTQQGNLGQNIPPTVVLTFQNDAGERRIMNQSRLLFYAPDNQQSFWVKPVFYRYGTTGNWVTINTPNEIPLYGGDRPVTPDANQTISIPSDGTAQLRFEIESGPATRDFFGLSISYQNGLRSNYFVVIK